MSALNVVYGTINKADNQGHYYNIMGELMGVEINEKTYALKDTTFFGSKRRKTTVSFSKLMELAAIDYPQFSEVDKMQGWLMSGLPDEPVFPHPHDWLWFTLKDEFVRSRGDLEIERNNHTVNIHRNGDRFQVDVTFMGLDFGYPRTSRSTVTSAITLARKVLIQCDLDCLKRRKLFAIYPTGHNSIYLPAYNKRIARHLARVENPSARIADDELVWEVS